MAEQEINLMEIEEHLGEEEPVSTQPPWNTVTLGHRPPAPGPTPATPTSKPDVVNHPIHYGMHPSGVECIDIVEHMSFNLGNSVKYIWRAGLKSDSDVETELRKAIWYIEREIERICKVK